MAEELGLPVGTVRQQLNRIGRRFGAPTAVRKAVALLAAGHVAPPPVSMLAPELSPTDLAVLRVLAGLARKTTSPPSSGPATRSSTASTSCVNGAGPAPTLTSSPWSPSGVSCPASSTPPPERSSRDPQGTLTRPRLRHQKRVVRLRSPRIRPRDQ